MDEFKKYIDSVLKGIGDDEERKELEDEFLDHLLMLKKEYLDLGLSEAEAIKKSIKEFGESRNINKGLEEALFPYKRLGQLFLAIVAVFIIVLSYKSISEINGYSHGAYGSSLEITAKLISEEKETRTYSITLKNQEEFEVNIASVLVGTHPVKVEAEPRILTIKPKESQEVTVTFPKLRGDGEKRDTTYIQIKGTIIDKKGNPRIIEIANAIKVD